MNAIEEENDCEIPGDGSDILITEFSTVCEDELFHHEESMDGETSNIIINSFTF